MHLPPRSSASSQPKIFLIALSVVLALTMLLLIRWLPSKSWPQSLSGHGDPTHVNDDDRSPTATTTLPATAAPEQPWHEAPARTGVDASNLYKNAFVLFDRLSEEEKKMISQPREEVDAEKAAALFEKVRAMLDLLHEAARADYCDWGQAPYSFETPLPQIAKGRDLGKLALWAAAYQFPTDPAAALTALSDRAQLGHHLSDTLIGVLVQTSFERSEHDLLLQQSGSFDAATAAQALDLVRGSRLDDDLAQAFESEALSVAELGRKLEAETASGKAKMLLGMMTPTEEEAQRATWERLDQFASDPARVAAEIKFIQEMEKATAAALRLPEAEFQAWRQNATAKMAEAHPLAQLTFPAFDGVQTRLQQTRVERTLLDAGLDILQNGPAELARYRDPATGTALLYVPTPTGFELRSTYKVKGKAVTLSFPGKN